MDRIERLVHSRRVDAIAADDSMPHLIDRIRGLLCWRRRITIARRYVDSDVPVDLKVGLTMTDGQPVESRIEPGQQAWIGVDLDPAFNRFGISWHLGDGHITEEEGWKRWHNGVRKDIIRVILQGGGPGDGGPGNDDYLHIIRYGTYGVGEEISIGFDTEHFYTVQRARDEEGWELAGHSIDVQACKDRVLISGYPIRCCYPLTDGTCPEAGRHVELVA